MRVIGKVSLSVFICFHIATMILVANPSSLLSRMAPHFMISYASTLGLNTTWQFFSPNPMGERYLEYEIHTENEPAFDDEQYYHYWPPKAESGMARENRNRAFYHSLFSTLNSNNIEEIFIPWACRRHPEALSISIRGETRSLPSIEVAGIKKKRFKDLSKSYGFNLEEHTCPRP